MNKNQSSQRSQGSPPAKSNSSVIRSLLIIDDAKLRRDAFETTERIIKKIDRLERQIAAFHDSDQRLFTNWFDLTFRAERQKVEDRRHECIELARFHNWIIATAKHLDISMPQAFRLMDEERTAYLHGDEATRKKIEADRRERDHFIQSEMEKEFRERRSEEWGGEWDDGGDGHDDDGGDGGDDDMPSVGGFGDEDMASHRSPMEEKVFAKLRGMSDAEVRRICRDYEGVVELLSIVSELNGGPEVFEIFLRIWDQTPEKHQKMFAREFSRQMGGSLQHTIEGMRAIVAQAKSAAGRGFGSADGGRGGEANEDEGDGEGNSNGDEADFAGEGSRYRWGPGGHKSSSRPLTGAEAEQMKLIYRKLVRRLHPDLQDRSTSGRELQWQRRMWDRAQVAHQHGDARELEKLYRLVLVRQREFGELTMGEIRESEHWLEGEHLRVKEEARDLKRLPAWGFSRARSHQTLIRRIQKDFDRELESIETEIEDLESGHAILEMLSLEYDEPAKRRQPKRGQRGRGQGQRRGKKSERASRKSGATKSRPRKPDWDDSGQTSFW